MTDSEKFVKIASHASVVHTNSGVYGDPRESRDKFSSEIGTCYLVQSWPNQIGHSLQDQTTVAIEIETYTGPEA